MMAIRETRRALDRVIRLERGRLLAGLVARFGAGSIDIAEDVAQDAMVAALETWSHKGLPDNAGAWLMRVATYKAIDRLRREGREVAYLDHKESRATKPNPASLSGDVSDAELRLIVLSCDPGLTQTEQVTLALKMISGFTARQIASVLLIDPSAVGQRVARALRKLRSKHIGQTGGPDSAAEVRAKVDTILKTIYLLFSLGYAPRAGRRLLLDDVCLEALRLAEVVADHPTLQSPHSAALAALINLQGARLPSRITADGHLVLLKDQDRTTWTQIYIDRGMSYLAKARAAQKPTRYHLEAAIAAAHTTAPSWKDTNWESIGLFYQALQTLTDSPVVAVNACVALAMSGDPTLALQKLETLDRRNQLIMRYPIDLARGEILALLGRQTEAVEALANTLKTDLSDPVRQYIEARQSALSGLALV